MAHARLSPVPPYLGNFTLRQTSTRKISGACKLLESWKSGEWREPVSSGWGGTDLWRFLANDRQSWDLFCLMVHLTEVKALRVGDVSDVLSIGCIRRGCRTAGEPPWSFFPAALHFMQQESGRLWARLQAGSSKWQGECLVSPFCTTPSPLPPSIPGPHRPRCEIIYSFH